MNFTFNEIRVIKDKEANCYYHSQPRTCETFLHVFCAKILSYMRKIILVTPKEKNVKEELDLMMQDMEQGLFKGMTGEERQQMAGGFEKLENNLKVYRKGGRIKDESNFGTVKTI